MFYTGLVPYRSTAAFVLPRAMDENAQHAEIVVSCPMYAVSMCGGVKLLTAVSFPL